MGSDSTCFSAKRRRQRNDSDASDFTIDDHLSEFTIPRKIRSSSTDTHMKAVAIERKIRIVVAASEKIVNNDIGQARAYVHCRQDVLEDASKLVKESRALLNSLCSRGVVDVEIAQELREELEEKEKGLVIERAYLAKNIRKAEYGILSYTPQTRVGGAYLTQFITSSSEMRFPDTLPDERQIRPDDDQRIFEARLPQAYNPKRRADFGLSDDDDRPEVPIWCPVRSAYSIWVTATHIVPATIGEVAATYLFGIKIQYGYEALWSVENGLMLESKIERAFNEGRLVIIPDKEELNEFVTVLLDDDYTSTLVGLMEDYHGLTFGDLHYRRLQFVSEARPRKRYLYTHALLALFRRKRCNAKGWENDAEKLGSARAWNSPEECCRRSIIEALAYEVGDAMSLKEAMGDEAFVADFGRQETTEEEARMAVIIRNGFENRVRRLDSKTGRPRVASPNQLVNGI
jgi:hypothetical protein